MIPLPPLVLMVEDDPDTAALFKAMLLGEGMEVVICSSGSQALTWWQNSTRPPNLLVLDVGLPDANGLDICRELSGYKDKGPLPPVMMLSADGDPRMPGLCQEAGVGVFLDKLRDMDRFLRIAKDMISRDHGQ